MSTTSNPSETCASEAPGGPPAEVPSQVRVAAEVLVILVLVIVGIALGLWVLYRLASVVLVLVLATLLAYLIAPLVNLARRPIPIAGRSRRLPRAAAIGLVYLLLAGAVSGAAALVLPSVTQQVSDIVSRAPMYAQSVVTWEHGWSKYYQRLRIPLELREKIDQSVLVAGEGALESVRGSLLALISAVASNLPWLPLIPILAFFLLKDATSVRRTIVIALPHRVQLRAHQLFEEVNATLAAFVRAQLIACVLVGSLCGLGFAVLGIPYSALLGTLAGVLEFIPLVGPLLLAIVASTVSALHAPGLAYWALGFLAVLRLVEDYVIYPRLMRRGIRIHPLAVIVAVLSGAELAGVAGMFLAVPAMAIASVVYRHWLEWRTVVASTDATRLARRLGQV